jgi:predicted nucleotidyltransferase
VAENEFAKTMLPLIKNNIKPIHRILKNHNVKRAFVFGSACTDKFTDNSDVDMIIAFNKRYFDNYVDNYLSLESELSKLLHRNVDLVTEETIQNPYFIQSINKTKAAIYES